MLKPSIAARRHEAATASGLDQIATDSIFVGTVGFLDPGKPDFGKNLDRFHKNKLYLEALKRSLDLRADAKLSSSAVVGIWSTSMTARARKSYLAQNER